MNIIDQIIGYLDNEYVIAGLFFLGGLLLGLIIKKIVNLIISKINSRLENRLDYEIINRLPRSLFWLLLFIGLYFGLITLTVLDPYTLYIQAGFYIIIVILITNFITRFLNFLIQKNSRLQEKFEEMPNLVSNVINFIIYVLGFLIALSKLNVNIAPLITALGISGIAIGLAVKTPLENIFSGFYVLTIKPLNVGDYIEVNDYEGYVADISWSVTKLRTLRENVIVIPNSEIVSNTITNYTLLSKEKGIRFHIGIAQDEDFDKVLAITKEVATEVQNHTEGCIPGVEPTVRYTAIGEFYVDLLIIIKAQKIDFRGPIKHALVLKLMKRYNAENIDMPPKIQRIHLRND